VMQLDDWLIAVRSLLVLSPCGFPQGGAPA
jgi:hypothetical protein